MRKKSVVKLVVAALCLALCLILPFITGQIREIGNMLCPMHLPVLLCGFLCGWPYGLAIGFIAPLLRSVLFGMPPLFPTALAMAFELAGYGFFSGFLFARAKQGMVQLYAVLVVAMLAGRAVWGLAQLVLLGLSGSAFTLAMFVTGAFSSAVPGILAQLVLVPLLVTAVRKAKVMA